jgi:preprotein translocase subunit YajC
MTSAAPAPAQVAADLPPAVPHHPEGKHVKNFALPLLIVFVYVLFIVPQARRRKQAAALRREVEPGAEVMLTSGLFGTVVEIDGDTVVIEAAEGVRLRYAKGAVQRVLPEPLDDTDDSDETDEHYHADGVDAADHDPHVGPDAAGADHDPTDDTIDEDVPRRDVVARPANRFKRSTRSRSTGNDAGPGAVPTP